MITRSDDLELLLAVVDNNGFSAAAESLGIQVAKISRAISRVESQLNTTLLNRTTRKISLTYEGEQFIQAIRPGLEQLQMAEEIVRQHAEMPSGKLRVDAASPFVLHQLVPLVSKFKHAYPLIELELTSNEGITDLLEHRTDVAIRVGGLADSELIAKPLGTSQLHIVASPEYLAKNSTPLTPPELQTHQLIGFVKPRILNKWPLKGLKEITPNISASSGEVVRQLTLSGNGIACLSGFMISEDLKRGTLVKLLENYYLKNTQRELVNAVYYKSSSVSARIRAFIEFLDGRLVL